MSTRSDRFDSLLVAAGILSLVPAGLAAAQGRGQGHAQGPAPMQVTPSHQWGGAALPPPWGRSGNFFARTGSLLPSHQSVPSVPSRPGFPGNPVPTPHSGPAPMPHGPGGSVDGVTGSAVRGSFGSDGLTVDGAFRGDHGSLAFHVGSPQVLADGRLVRMAPFRRFGFVHPWWGHGVGYWPYGYAYNYWDYGYGYDNSTVYGTGGPYVDAYVTGQTPPAQPAQPERALTAVELGQIALQDGNAHEAVKQFREHLRTKVDDTPAMRLLAVALLDDKRLDEAAAVMAMAYDKEPMLARTPLDPAVMGADSEGLRRRVLATVTFANRVDSSSAWTLVASLMQAEGRDAMARKIIDRAKAKGLSARVYGEFDGALAK